MVLAIGVSVRIEGRFRGQCYSLALVDALWLPCWEIASLTSGVAEDSSVEGWCVWVEVG